MSRDAGYGVNWKKVQKKLEASGIQLPFSNIKASGFIIEATAQAPQALGSQTLAFSENQRISSQKLCGK